MSVKSFRNRVDALKQRIVSIWADKDRDTASRAYARLLRRGEGSYLAAPDTLQAIAEFSPVSSDLFDVGRFLRARRNETILDRVIDDNSEGYAPFVNAAQSVWSALINTDPTPQDIPGDKPAWYDTHAKVMRAMMEMPEFKKLHETTHGSTLFTSAAMHDLLPVVRKLIDEMLPPDGGGGGGQNNPDPDKEKGDGEGDGDGRPQDGNGQPDKDKIQQALRNAMNKAADKNDKNEDAMRACGMEPPENLDMDPSQYMKLVQEFQNNPWMRRLLDSVGRLGRIARAKAKRLIPGFAGYGTRRFLGDELNKVPDYKLSEVVVRPLRKQFLLEMCSGELPQVVEDDNAPPGRGPVVLLTDESGSMQEGQHLIAKALAVASIRTAREHNRKAWGVSFSSEARFHDTMTPQGMHAFMTSNMNGGTSFEAALDVGMRQIVKDRKARQADIMILTDGACSVSDEFTKRFGNWKYRTGARLFVVLIGGYDVNYYKESLGRIADHVVSVNNLTNEKEAAKAFESFWTKLSDSPVTHKELDEREAAGEAPPAAPAANSKP